MNAKREQWLRLSNRMLAGTMTLLGFAACSTSCEQADEYGTPYATFEIKGNVVDAENNGIDDGRVILKELGKEDIVLYRDTVPTTTGGVFDLKFHGMGKTKYRVVGEDMSGEYRPDSVDVELEPQGESKGWYQGSDMKEVTIQLTKKQNAE